MSRPFFNTSLRRDPTDPRGLAERIDALVIERIEEAVELACLDLLIQLRGAEGRRAPEAQSEQDRQEFQGLVRELLLDLRSRFLEGLAPDDLRKVGQAEEAAGRQDLRRLLAGQAALARTVPDYWQRLETLRVAFVRSHLTPAAAKAGWLRRLFRRS